MFFSAALGNYGLGKKILSAFGSGTLYWYHLYKEKEQ